MTLMIYENEQNSHLEVYINLSNYVLVPIALFPIIKFWKTQIGLVLIDMTTIHAKLIVENKGICTLNII